MLDEFKTGQTPNPDIMCNQEIKFKLFLETALADGADMIATGHYARIQDGQLLTAKNTDKDQTYFLYSVSEDALKRSLMPIGEFKTKEEVRKLATEFGLATAEKKDSQGICFVGKVGIREFLEEFVTDTESGDIIDQNGKVIGQHDGALFYTIGQRHGLSVGGGLPYYVAGKDMDKNEVYVTTDLDDDRLWKTGLKLTAMHWINGEPDDFEGLEVRTRYRQSLVAVQSFNTSGKNREITLKEPVRAVTPGQSAVFYRGDRCLGGGIVSL
jgi:tRNA-specific 2-thiouridylase